MKTPKRNKKVNVKVLFPLVEVSIGSLRNTSVEKRFNPVITRIKQMKVSKEHAIFVNGEICPNPSSVSAIYRYVMKERQRTKSDLAVRCKAVKDMNGKFKGVHVWRIA